MNPYIMTANRAKVVLDADNCVCGQPIHSAAYYCTDCYHPLHDGCAHLGGDKQVRCERCMTPPTNTQEK